MITSQLLMGVHFVVAKNIVSVLPPLVWASFRLIVAAFLMLVIAAFSGRPHPDEGWKYFGLVAWFSVLGIIFNQATFLLGLHFTSPTNSAIVCTLLPVVTGVFVVLRGQEPFRVKTFVGIATGMVGVSMMRPLSEFHWGDATWIGDGLILISVFCTAAYLTLGKRFMQSHDPVWSTAWLFFFGSFGMAALALPDWKLFVRPEVSPTMYLQMIYAIIGGTLIPYFLTHWALARTQSSTIALFACMQPLVAGFTDWVWTGRSLTSGQMWAGGWVFAGLIIATQKVRTVRVKP